VGSIDAILLVLLGVTFALIGYRIVRFMASLLFGGLLGIIGFQLVLSSLDSMIIAFIAGIALFFVGAVIGLVIFKVGLSLVGGYASASIIINLLPNIDVTVPSKYLSMALLALAIVMAVIIYVVLDHVIAIGLAIIGGLLVLVGLTYWLPLIVSAPVTLALTIAGAMYQVKRIEEKREK